MRILYVVSGRSYCSPVPSRKILALVECWQKRGWAVDLICGGDLYAKSSRGSLDHSNQRSTRVKPSRLRTTKLPRPLVETLSEVRNLLHDLRLALRLRRYLRDHDPDLCVFRSSRLDGVSFGQVLKSGVSLALEWKDQPIPSLAAKEAMQRDDFYKYSLFKWLVRYVEEWKEKSASYLVVESHELKGRLAASLARSKEDFFVAHNAVCWEDFDRTSEGDVTVTRTQLKLCQNAFVVAFVGSFSWYQGVELLVRAMAIDHEFDSTTQVLLVGDGPGRESVETLVSDLGLEAKFIFTGSVPPDSVKDYLALADAAVLPNCTDIICPIKVQEYMAAKVVALVPNFPANREVIEHEVSGLLFQPGNPQSLSQELSRLRDDPELARRIADAALSRVKADFNWDATWGAAVAVMLGR